MLRAFTLSGAVCLLVTVILAFWAAGGIGPGHAKPLAARPEVAVARLDLAASSLRVEGRDRGQPRPLTLRLVLDHPVPWRAYLVADPPRLVLDFRMVDFGNARPGELAGAEHAAAIRWGPFQPGWSRLVVELAGPARIDRADMAPRRDEDGARLPGVVLEVHLVPVALAEFDPAGGNAPESALWDLPAPAAVPPPAAQPGNLRIMLDPGHGGLDPGAVAGSVTEAELMLILADEVAGRLRRAGVDVFLTREGDAFMGLEARASAARAAGADALISLHADALPEGEAAGAAVYVWDRQADGRAAAELVLRHDRDDLLAGLDLAGADDEVATVLMDLARHDTRPRSEALAAFIVTELQRADVPMHRRPLQRAAFSVLKSPDIPSVLVETGFLTDQGDRARLADPLSRARLASVIARAILTWAHDDRLRSPLLRQ